MKTEREKLRRKHEIEVLKTTVFRGTRTDAEVIRAAIKYTYDRVLAERVDNTAATLRD